MSNNRLYLQDTESGDFILLAKSYGGGWVFERTGDELTKWVSDRDKDSSRNANGSTRLKLLVESDAVAPGFVGNFRDLSIPKKSEDDPTWQEEEDHPKKMFERLPVARKK